MKKKAAAVIAAGCALALAVCPLVGCSSESAEEPAPASTEQAQEQQEDRVVTDMNGDEVTVPAEKRTVLTANSVATQMVLMLGGEDAAASLGQGFSYGDGSLNKAMFPDLGDVRTFTRDDVTVENVAAADPGIVVIDVADTVTLLREAGIPAAYMTVTSPETIMEAVEMIGEAIGGDAVAKADEYVAYYQDKIDEISGASASLSDDEKPRVLYLRSTTRTTGAGSMPESWITAAGGINVGTELGLSGSGADVTTETILAADPDIIVCEKQEDAAEILSNSVYAQLSAVQNGTVYAAPLGTAVWSMGTAEAVLQLSWAATVINPDLYADVDVDAQTREFFSTFYGYDLSDAELDAIFHRS